MSDAPVDPAEVPVYTGDLGSLQAKVTSLAQGGTKVKTAGSDVHTSFGGLSAFYHAPEAEQLFAVTEPVARTARTLGDEMQTVSKALGTYAQEITPLVDQLNQLRQEAADFRAKDAAEDDWNEDGDLAEENLARRNKIAEVWTAFQRAERDCHGKIVALVGGTALRTNDGTNQKGMYGYDAEALKQSKSLPWGDAVEESVPAWQVWEHVYDFGKGLIVDGLWGTVRGLGTLVGVDGWDAAGEAWVNLAKLSTAITIATMPGLGAAYLTMPGSMLPSWLRDSRKAMFDTGKAMLAWDQWGTNNSRAAGAVTFNVLTALFTRGGGAAVSGAGKAGTAAKALSFAGKAGQVIDPMTYVFKGAGAGASKIGDVLSHLKNLRSIELPKFPHDTVTLPDGARLTADGTIHLPTGQKIPDGFTRLPDGTVKAPDHLTVLPPGTVRLPTDGPPRFLAEDGTIYRPDGTVEQHAQTAPRDMTSKPTEGADRPRVDSPSHREESVVAGVGGRGDEVVRVGSEMSGVERVGSEPGHGAGRTDNTGSHSIGSTVDHMPVSKHSPDESASHTPDTGGSDHTSGAGHTTGARSGSDSPGSDPSTPHKGDSPIGTGGPHDLPGTGDLDSLGHTGDDAAGHESVRHGSETSHLPGNSEARPDGARYVEEPAPEDAQAARFYDEVRANPDTLDINTISSNTGIDTQVLDRVRTHFFLTKHLVTQGPDATHLAYFTPRGDLAEIWQAAGQRSLSPEETIKFERYIAHEYMESHLIEVGVPYLRDEPHLWEHFQNPDESGYYRAWPREPSDAGAHELAASENRGGLNHLRSMGFDVPNVELAPNLSNIDEVVAALFQELQSKGIDLK